MQNKQSVYDSVSKILRDDLGGIALDCVGVGVSGGRDSLVLLHILKEMHVNVCALHCNFQLRGDESERDMTHTLNVCEEWGVECKVSRFDTLRYAAEQKISIEMAARQLRYDWFDELLYKGSVTALALGHHRKDSIETVVLNLLRGSGIKGLLGIPKVNGLYFRPLHALSEIDLNEYALKYGIKYVVDSTNAENKYKRNLVRNAIIPLFEEVNTDAVNHIYDCSERLLEVHDIYNEYILNVLKRVTKWGSVGELIVDIKTLRSEKYFSSLLYELLSKYGFSGTTIQTIAAQCETPITGKQFFSDEYRLLVDRERLLIIRNEVVNPKSYIIDCNSTGVDELNYLILISEKAPSLEELKELAQFHGDYSKLRFPLVLRHWQVGDIIRPYGMKGKRLLSDVFSDLHYSVFQKESVWLLVDADNEVIWIANQRGSEKTKIEGTTKLFFSLRRIEK